MIQNILKQIAKTTKTTIELENNQILIYGEDDTEETYNTVETAKELIRIDLYAFTGVEIKENLLGFGWTHDDKYIGTIQLKGVLY